MSDIVSAIFQTLSNEMRNTTALSSEEWENYVLDRLPNYRPLTEAEEDAGTIYIWIDFYYAGNFEWNA